MNLPRIIPALLLRDGALVKTERFKKPEYVGDPINTVRIYNEKGADELIFLDIAATREAEKSNFQLIEQISCECYMPLADGGGLNNFDDVRRVLASGAEKVVLNSAAVHDEHLVSQVAEHFGSQRVIVSIDVKKARVGKKKQVMVSCGQEKTGMDPTAWAKQAVALGAGELMVTSIDREGTFNGYDRELVRAIAQAVPVPVIAHGGAASVEDLREVIQEDGAAAAAAGGLFVCRSAMSAVLINHPNREALDEMFDMRSRARIRLRLPRRVDVGPPL